MGSTNSETVDMTLIIVIVCVAAVVVIVIVVIAAVLAARRRRAKKIRPVLPLNDTKEKEIIAGPKITDTSVTEAKLKKRNSNFNNSSAASDSVLAARRRRAKNVRPVASLHGTIERETIAGPKTRAMTDTFVMEARVKKR